MRFLRQLLHWLVGLLGLAILAATASWIWPEDSRQIWFLAYAAIAASVFWELIDKLRNRNGEQGDNCG
ncbi:hypothetical protein [Sphingopyxis sp. H115]|uniref:hypothetical protein n=1 Tax=Sphingopyxis sp. H115 TaxID=1759073 RepID=UPI000B2A5B96|nr:hypothetical protein [Sphingopyxis sp. H115]